MSLSHVVIAYETEAAARQRLVEHGYAPDLAAEIAVYLAQATDLPEFFDDIAQALGRAGLSAEFVTLDALPARLLALAPNRADTIVWAVTDGVRFYRGSAISALARLTGFPRYGSPATAAHLCQDKFASLVLAAAAGLAISPTRMYEGADEVAALGDWRDVDGPIFVKPNTLGAKIGIFADSRCATLDEAKDRARRLWERYRDRALIQPFLEGDDVRVSFMDCGGAFADQLGVARLVKDPRGETAGAFMTMKDNETLSGARDTAGGRGGFGAAHAAAFTPAMADLRAAGDAHSRAALAAILDMAARLKRVVGLQDYFSLDFRVDLAGRPTFFEFEVCPAVTIYDFQTYLTARHRLGLGEALARSLKRAYARAGSRGEA